MSQPLPYSSLDTIFRQARTHTTWLRRPVEDDLLRRAYDLARLGPTSANMSPMRVVFVKSAEAKERLKPALMPGNVQKTLSAPVCAIVADDTRFFEHLPRLFPHAPTFGDTFKQPGNEELTRTSAFRNSTLQGAYLIIALRSLGLDTGPMSGFDNAKVDAEFFPDGRFKSNFLINIGYGDSTGLHPRLPRLEFDEACQIV